MDPQNIAPLRSRWPGGQRSGGSGAVSARRPEKNWNCDVGSVLKLRRNRFKSPWIFFGWVIGLNWPEYSIFIEKYSVCKISHGNERSLSGLDRLRWSAVHTSQPLSPSSLSLHFYYICWPVFWPWCGMSSSPTTSTTATSSASTPLSTAPTTTMQAMMPLAAPGFMPGMFMGLPGSYPAASLNALVAAAALTPPSLYGGPMLPFPWTSPVRNPKFTFFNHCL